MTYEIEHDVEIPPRGGAKYPWQDMKDGDSIVVEEAYAKGKGSAAGSSAQSWLKRNRPGWSAVARREDDDLCRIWFVEGGGMTAIDFGFETPLVGEEE